MAPEQKRGTFNVTHIAPKEWRWVTTLGIFFIILVSLPLVWAVWTDISHPDYRFMGFVANPIDSATYLSKIQLGQEGYWKTFFRHSPNADEGAYVTLFYTFIGHLTGFMGMPSLLTFHISRLLTAFLMFLSLYHLGATIWRRERTRQIFFVLVIIGSGFGWFMFAFNQDMPDLTIPEAFPLYSAAANPHFPLVLALISLNAAIILNAFRPGQSFDPDFGNGGLPLFLSSLVLGIISPHVLVPFTVAFGLLIAIDWYRQRKIRFWQFRWLMMIVLPAAPIGLYYLAEVYYNPVIQLWNAQNQTLSPPIHILLLGFGLPLIVALPGIYRAFRRFEADGDQLMLLWLIAILIMLYIPVNAQRRFSIGIMIPITYFAVRSIEDYWMVNRTQIFRNRLLAVVYGISGMTYLFLMVLWFWTASSYNGNQTFLDRDYDTAFKWLSQEVEPDTVILASESVSLWIPGYAGMRVVYGHPFETLNAESNREQVREWYAASDADDPICRQVLTEFNVQYVIVGPVEGDEPACADGLTEVWQSGDVVIYAS